MKPVARQTWQGALATGLGLVAVFELVWFVGPTVAIGEVYPLAGEAARWAAIGGLSLLAAGFAVWRAVRSQRNNRLLLEGMAAADAAPSPAAAAAGQAPGGREVEVIGQRFEQAVALLRQRRTRRRRGWRQALVTRPYVYELPWYVIIGAPGAGKTTALLNSGLEFPLASQLGQKVIRGVGGTRNCDWWFADEAVFIDTAGRYTTQDSHEAADRTAWLGFLDLLVRHRPGRPINGLLLTLSASDLLHPDPQRRLEHARALRSRIDEVHARLGIQLPIYVLVTKTDLLCGFVEFFADFDKDERAQVWGATLAQGTKATLRETLAQLAGELGDLGVRLTDFMFARLIEEHDRERRAAIYSFPQQWRVMRDALLEMLPEIFAADAAAQPPMLRGLYFTSATQEGTPIDRAIGGLARALGLSGRLLPPARSSAKTYFVTRMLRDVVLQEAGLAGTNLRWQRRRRLQRWALGGATAGAVAGAAGLAVAGLVIGREVSAPVAEQVAALRTRVEAARHAAPTDVVALLPTLQTLSALAAAAPSAPTWLPGWLDVRHGQAELYAATARDGYLRLLREGFVPRVANRLEDRLRHGADEPPRRLYEDLKAYLMLFSGTDFDRVALRSFLLSDWDESLPASVGRADRLALRQHLDQLLAGGEVGAPSQVQPEVVAQARSLLERVPLAQRAYGRLQQVALGADAAPLTLEALGGPVAARVFDPPALGPAGLTIPGLYTRAVFQQSFHDRAVRALAELAAEQRTVLGTSAAADMEPARQTMLIDEVERLYVEDYRRRWTEFIGALHLKPTASLAQTAELAQSLSRVDSALRNVLVGAVRQLEVGEPADAPPPARGGARDAGAGPPVDPGFVSLRQFVSGRPSTLDNVLELLGRLATQLSAVDDAVQRKAAPASLGVLAELSAQLAKAPAPVRGLLEPLATSGADQAFAALRRPISQRLALEVAPACQHATAGRYPLLRSAAQELSRDDFTRMFAADGLINGFFRSQLAPFVDVSGQPWVLRSARGQGGEAADALAQFQRAESIRQAFFRDDGRGLRVALEFRLLDLDPAIRRFTLDVDGQVLSFGRDQRAAQSLKWPGPDGAGHVNLRLALASNASTPDYRFEGAWSLFRLFDRVRIQPGAGPDRIVAEFDVEGRKARFEVRSATPLNPLNPRELEQFQCPQKL